MKPSFLHLTKLVLLAFIVLSCKKEEPKVSAPTVARSNFHATIGNKPWDAKTAYAMVEDGRIKVYGISADGKTLQFDLAGTTAIKYKVNEFQQTKVLYSADSAKNYDGKVPLEYSGEIVVSSYDLVKKTLSGSFNLVLEETVDKRLLGVEDGVFTDVPIVSNTFEEISLMALYKLDDGANTIVVRADINALGELNLNELKDLGQLNIYLAGNYSFYESNSNTYGYGDPEGELFLSYQNGDYQLRNDWFFAQAAPITLNGNCYSIAVKYGSPDRAFIRRLHLLTGDTLETLINFPLSGTRFEWERNSSCQDGKNIYFLSYHTIEKYDPNTGARKSINLNPQATLNLNFNGIEAMMEDQVLAIRSVDEKACTLTKITTSGSLPAITDLISFEVPSCLGCQYNSAYNKSTNVYYLLTYEFDQISDDVTTTIRAFNLNTNRVSQVSYPGYLFGAELLD